MKAWIAAIMLALTLWPVMAESGWSVADYEKSKDLESTRMYILGLAKGFEWANADLAARHQPVLYCEPGTLALVPQNYIQILEETISNEKRRNAEAEKFHIAPLLLEGLQYTFPCDQPHPGKLIDRNSP